MLKLQRLDISGFKTFVDPVSTDFSEGITAIVGPNGCGKSNLSEAVTWVLGEQSAKSLRGGRMEDVIFSGSEKRKALGMAEVALTFQTDGTLGHEDEENRITIGRRVFRTGESQYRLNDKTVRLKDIKDILMDTGLGVRAYSVIEQGRIGMILSGKPQDRRKLIEEAAGITRYKQRKRLAEIKLEEASGNLLRLDDIIAEVERALRSLKRQASAARRFQEREATYRELLETVLIRRYERLHQVLAQLEHRLEETGAKDQELAGHLERSQAALLESRDLLDQRSREVAESHQHHANLAATIEGRQEFLKATRQTINEIEERLQGGLSMADQRRQELNETNQALLQLAGRGANLVSERDLAEAAIAEEERRLQMAEEALKAAQAKLEALRSQLMTSLNRVNSLQNRQHQEQIENEKATLGLQHLDSELEQSKARLATGRTELEATENRQKEARGRLDAISQSRTRAATELDAVLQREAESEAVRQELKHSITDATSRQKVLAELSRKETDRRDQFRSSLNEMGYDHLRFLDDEVVVSAGWEEALDLYLEQARDAVLIPADEDPFSVADALASLGSGGAVVQAGDPYRRWDGDRPYDAAIVSTLGEALGLPAEFTESLPPTFLVETGHDALRLAAIHRGYTFISRDCFWAQNGVLHFRGQAEAPGTLARTRELHELTPLIAGFREQLNQTESQLTHFVDQRTALAAQIHQMDSEISELKQTLAVAEARLHDARETCQALEEANSRIEGQRRPTFKRRSHASRPGAASLRTTFAGRAIATLNLKNVSTRRRLALTGRASCASRLGARAQTGKVSWYSFKNASNPTTMNRNGSPRRSPRSRICSKPGPVRKKACAPAHKASTRHSPGQSRNSNSPLRSAETPRA